MSYAIVHTRGAEVDSVFWADTFEEAVEKAFRYASRSGLFVPGSERAAEVLTDLRLHGAAAFEPLDDVLTIKRVFQIT